MTLLSAVVSIFVFRFRSRAALELKLIALQHQLAVLHRQSPGRPQLSSLDRLLWVWLYRIWPQVIDAMVLVKPTTVVDWHRRGLPALLALAVTSSGTAQNRPRNPRFNPPHEQGQPVMGRAAHPWGTAQARHQRQPGHRRPVDAVAPQGPLPDLAQLSAQSPFPTSPRSTCSWSPRRRSVCSMP